MASKRIKRVNQLIQEELANILLKEIELPIGIMATISRIETAADLKSAKAHLSIIPFARAQEILRIFKKNISHIQYALGQQVKLKFTPKIKFFIDSSEDRAGQINRFLDEIKKE